MDARPVVLLDHYDNAASGGTMDTMAVLAGILEARLDKAIGETLILKEIVLLFIRVWLEHNPPIDEALEESAAASAEARFERFLDLVAQALAPGQSLASRELQTSFSATSAGVSALTNGEAHT